MFTDTLEYHVTSGCLGASDPAYDPEKTGRGRRGVKRGKKKTA